MLKGFSKAEKSWMMYDWANSAHSVIVVTILPIFYNSLTSNGTHAVANWGTCTSIAMLIVALMAPFLGLLGDFKNWKKRMFTGFVILGVLACAAMAFTPYMTDSTSVETLGLVILILYILSTIGFSGANLYYDSFLTDVTTEDRMDKVSLIGYGLGYIGGSTIPLVIFLVMNLMKIPMNFCLAFAFGLTAVWWSVFTIPLWKNVHQTLYIDRQQHMFSDTLRNLVTTLKEIIGYKSLFIFMIAYFFYIDGVGTIIHMSTIYGSVLGIDSTQMLLALLAVQVLGLPFAMLYSKLSDKLGSRFMIGVGICIYMGICVFGFFVREAWHFWVLAILVSTSQGGIQALSRSTFGKLIPDKKKSAEFFGFFDIFGKFSTILGPALFGWASAWASSIILNKLGLTPESATAEQMSEVTVNAAPWGVLAVLGIFIIGALLYFVVLPRVEKKEKKG